MAKVITVANRKGGTGKTTTAVNVSAEWGRRGKKVLLIDLDTQGHASIGVGCGIHHSNRPSIHDVFREPEKALVDLILDTPTQGVWLLAADTSFDGIGTEISTLLLKKKLHELEQAKQFDVVVIDTPPTLDVMLLNALTACHGILVPFVPHFLAEVGVRQLADLFYKVAVTNNENLKMIGLLPIMLDKRTKLHNKVLASLVGQFGKNRMLRGVRSNIRLAEAFEQGLPVSGYAPKSAGAMDYYMLVEELEALWN